VRYKPVDRLLLGFLFLLYLEADGRGGSFALDASISCYKTKEVRKLDDVHPMFHLSTYRPKSDCAFALRSSCLPAWSWFAVCSSRTISRFCIWPTAPAAVPVQVVRLPWSSVLFRLSSSTLVSPLHARLRSSGSLLSPLSLTPPFTSVGRRSKLYSTWRPQA